MSCVNVVFPVNYSVNSKIHSNKISQLDCLSLIRYNQSVSSFAILGKIVKSGAMKLVKEVSTVYKDYTQYVLHNTKRVRICELQFYHVKYFTIYRKVNTWNHSYSRFSPRQNLPNPAPVRATQTQTPSQYLARRYDICYQKFQYESMQ